MFDKENIHSKEHMQKVNKLTAKFDDKKSVV